MAYEPFFRAQAMVVSRNEHSPTSSECQLIRQIETQRMLQVVIRFALPAWTPPGMSNRSEDWTIDPD
jgi:hypothetical protein